MAENETTSESLVAEEVSVKTPVKTIVIYKVSGDDKNLEAVKKIVLESKTTGSIILPPWVDVEIVEVPVEATFVVQDVAGVYNFSEKGL